MNAAKGKTSRACDICVKRLARWFCAADDAFLCQTCDTSVHSANLLARRHKRVLLKSATHTASSPLQEAATWHPGFTRKPRTPRGSGKKKNNSSIFHDLVPEISVDDQTSFSSELEEQLLCQVPVLDPVVAHEQPKKEFPMVTSGVMNVGHEDEDNVVESCLNGFFTTDMELEKFAADVETILGHTKSCEMEDVGLLNTDMFKIEKEEETKAMNMGTCDRDDRVVTDPFELNFDYESNNTYKEEAIKNVERSKGECVKVKEEEQKNVPMLKLNYDLVISTWGGQGLPWTSGGPPKLDIDIGGSAPIVSMGESGGESYQKHYIGGCSTSSGLDGGRKASVLRYREKRRTRLFSKTIRYEVRKLNAEKRPRLKGRFVKRASLPVSNANSPLAVND